MSSITIWIITAIIFFIPYGLISAELGSTYPDDGGIYSWVNRAYGEKTAVMVGWYYWVNVAFWMPAVFIAFAALDDAACLPALIDMINARFGIKLTADGVTNLGMSILKIERGFNLAAGFTNEDDRLPEFFQDEAIAPHNVVWDISDEALDSFWNF